MKVFDYDSELNDVSNDSFWKSLFESNTFEFGVLNLRPNQEDTQSPHKMDEVYFITSGDGYLRINETDHEIKKGRIFFVPKGVKHKFHGNTITIQGFYALG